MGGTLGEFEQMVLFAVVRLDEEAYGAAVRREIEERTGREVSAGSVYTVLDRLEQRGLVESWVGQPTPERGGRRKKYYRLEPLGAEFLALAHGRMQRMAEGILPRLDELRGDASA